MPSNPYGKLPIIGIWALFGSSFYFFLAYQSIGERGIRNRKWLREVLQLTPPSQESSAEELKYQALLEETTYDPKHDKET